MSSGSLIFSRVLWPLLVSETKAVVTFVGCSEQSARSLLKTRPCVRDGAACLSVDHIRRFGTGGGEGGAGVWFGRVLFWVNGVWKCGAACDQEGQEELLGEVDLVTVGKRLN